MAGDVLHDARDGFDPSTAPAAELLQTRARPLRDAARRPARDQPLRRRRRRARPRRRQPRRRGAPRRRRAPGRWPSSAAPRSWCARPSARASPRPTYAGSSGSCATWSPTPSTTPRAGDDRGHRRRRRAGRRDRRPRPRRRPARRASRRWSSTGSGAPTRPAPAPAAAPASACRSRSRTPTCTAAGCRPGASPGEGAQFRLTLPRRRRHPLRHSPLPLVPDGRRGGGRMRGARILVVRPLALVTAAGLTACVRVPDHGPVVEADDSQDQVEDVQPPFSNPLPPQKGAAADDIVAGFLEAMTATPLKTTGASEYLTSQARTDVAPRPACSPTAPTTWVSHGTTAVAVRLHGAERVGSRGQWRRPRCPGSAAKLASRWSARTASGASPTRPTP